MAQCLSQRALQPFASPTKPRNVRASAVARGPQQQRAAAGPRTAARHAQQEALDVPTFWARALLVQQHGDDQQQQQQQPAIGGGSSSSSGGITAAAACGAVALGAALLALMPAQAAHAAAHGGDVTAQVNASFDLAEGQEFWGNVARYGRYFVTVMLGTGYVMLRPLAGMFKNPVTGVLAVVGVAGAAYGVKVTLEAMLGLSEPFDYLPAQNF